VPHLWQTLGWIKNKGIVMGDTTKLMGFVPQEKYVFYTYYLLLASAAGSLVLTILSMGDIHLPFDLVFALAGLGGVILALAGLFFYRDKFGAHDRSHLTYIAILFGVFFLVGIVLGLGGAGMSLSGLTLLSILLGTIQLALYFTGYNSWKRGRMITKENFKDEVRLALKRA
jgi:O-antigen/teichoic acid export membrane protein